MIEKQDIFTIMGGRVRIKRGIYNPTSDAVWLAAFIDGTPKTVLDVGCGTGAVGLCLMARLPGIKLTALDISPDMIAAARENFELNKKNADFIIADILKWRTDAVFDLVITNPPYFNGTPATHNAHHNADIMGWVRKCVARVRPNGTFATIVDSVLTATVLTELARHCGDIRVLPLFSNKNVAERVLISGRVGRRPHTTVYAGMDMNSAAILRAGQPISHIIKKG